MAKAKVRLSYRWIGDAARKPKVRKALAGKAAQVRSRAERIAASEGVSLDSSVTEGTRPKGRPYANVTSPNVAQEFGTARVRRRRILGRAAEGA